MLFHGVIAWLIAKNVEIAWLIGEHGEIGLREQGEIAWTNVELGEIASLNI